MKKEEDHLVNLCLQTRGFIEQKGRPQIGNCDNRTPPTRKGKAHQIRMREGGMNSQEPIKKKQQPGEK